MNFRSITGTRIIALFMTVSLLVAGCGVTGPDENVWSDVRDFSWPVDEGASMKYYTYESPSDITPEDTIDVTVTREDSFLEFRGMPMYLLHDHDVAHNQQAHFLPLNKDTLVVDQMGFGGQFALVAPLEKGHRWYSAADSAWEAEVVERFAYRKVEGKVYEDVVVVRYRRPELLGGANQDKEYIRFYAKGVGEILTIVNDFHESSSSVDVLPTQGERKVLVEQSPAS